MFFEFIFLIFKKQIYSQTKGEPWKDLAFMIALAAILAGKVDVSGRRCGIILSGGNVDSDVYADVLSGA